MGDLTKGTTWNDGEEVRAARLNQMVDEATLTSSAIIGKTEVNTPANPDKLLIYDDSAVGLRSITYLNLKTDILSGASTQRNLVNVTQNNHGFLVGDVIRIQADGTYAKSRGKFNSIVVSSVDTASNRLTIPGGTTLAIGTYERVFLTSSGILPSPLQAGRFYYVGDGGSATQIKLYPTRDDAIATTNELDLIDVGTGTHTIWSELESNTWCGVVTSQNTHTFAMTVSGKASGLTFSNSLIGKVLFLDPAVSGGLTATPPSSDGAVIVPVLVPISATDAMLAGVQGDTLVRPKSIGAEEVKDGSMTASKLDSVLQSAIGQSQSTLRQTVLSSRTDFSGCADYLQGENPSSLTVTIRASAQNPIIATFANGWGLDGKYDLIGRLTNDIPVTVPAGAESFIYLKREASGGITAGAVQQAPLYNWVRSRFRSDPLIPRDGSNVTILRGNDIDPALESLFDMTQKRTGTNGVRFTAGGNTTLVRLNLTYPKKVNRYLIRLPIGTAAGTTFPTSWLLEGSNDLNTWVGLDNRVGQVLSNASGQVAIYDCQTPSETAFKYYRFTFSGYGVSLGNYWEISDLNLFETADHCYVIPEGVMYEYSGGGWSKVNQVFVGELRLASGALNTLGLTPITYGNRGEFTATIAVVGASISEVSHNLGTRAVTSELWLRANPGQAWVRAADATTINSWGARAAIGDKYGDPCGMRNKAFIACEAYPWSFNVLSNSMGVTPFQYLGPRYNYNTDASLTYGQAMLVVKRMF